MLISGVDVHLAAKCVAAHLPPWLHNDAEQQHARLKFRLMFFASYIHNNAVYRIRPIAVWLTKACAYRVESAMFRFWTKNSWAVHENLFIVAPVDIKACVY